MKNFKYATHPKIQNLRLPAIAVLFNAGKAGIFETSNLPDNSLLVGYLDDQPVITVSQLSALYSRTIGAMSQLVSKLE